MGRQIEYDAQRCGQRLQEIVHSAEFLTIIAPFITVSGIRPLLAALPDQCSLEIFTRWRPEEVASGVSDPHVLDLIAQRGGSVALHPLVHAKAYIAGSQALVGSANLTSNGLGWHRPGAVELLVETSAEDPALVSLLTTLRATAAPASVADRDTVLAAAEMLPTAQLRAATDAADRADWLPTYRSPAVLWKVYTGQREESVAELVRPDLAALGVPQGLDSEETFNSYVGAVLLQGLTGRVARECSNLTTVRAVEQLSRLCDDLGLVIRSPAEKWETLSAWIAHFIPTYNRIPGGTRLIG